MALNRVLSIILVLVTLLSVSVSADSAYNTDGISENNAYERAETVLETLAGSGFLTGGSEETEITRAEFVAGLEKLLGIAAVGGDEQIFEDVGLTHRYADEIYTAYKLKWIGKSYNFRPSDALKYSEGIKVAVVALGYDIEAASGGGYPTGYLKCASDLKLSSGMDGVSESLTKHDVYILFYNMLNTKVYKQISYGGILQYAKSGETLLSSIYDLRVFEGIVTATPYNSLISASTKLAENRISVNGISYKYDGAMPDMLGRNYDFYITTDVDAEEKIVLAVEKTYETININMSDAVLKNSRTIQSESDNIRLHSPYTLILNGTKSSKNISAFVGKTSCTATVIDADKDGEFETVLIKDYDYIVADGVDSDGGFIGDKNGKNINLSDYKCKYFIDGQKNSGLHSVKKGGVYAVLKSEDGNLVSLEKCDNTVSGTVGAKNTADGTLYVGDTEYYVSDYFKNYCFSKVVTGRETTFSLGINGELVYMADSYSEYFYGYLIGTEKGKGLSREAKIKIYSENDSMLFLPAADKLTVDGVKLTDGFDKYLSSPGGAKFNVPQMVRFKVKDGYFTHIDFSEISDAANPIDYDRSSNDDNSLTRYSFDKYVYRSTSMSFAPYFSVELTKVFYIPETLEDDLFAVRTNTVFTNAKNYTNLEVYDIDDTGNAAVVTLSVREREELTYSNSVSYVVERLSRELDENGAEVNVINVWRNGKIQKFVCPETVSVLKPTGKPIRRGDLVSIYSYDGINVTNLRVDFDAESGTVNTGVVFNEDNLGTSITYNGGFVYSAGGTYLVLDKSADSKAVPDFTQSNLRVLAVNYNSQRNIYIYDSGDDTVTAVSASAIRTSKAYGGTYADYCLARHYLGAVQTVYIYR